MFAIYTDKSLYFFYEANLTTKNLTKELIPQPINRKLNH